MSKAAALSNADRYVEYVRGADANDRLRFDAGVIAYLSAVVDEELFTKALESAAGTVIQQYRLKARST